MNSETVIACTRPAQAQKDKIPALRKGSEHKALPPPRSYSQLIPAPQGIVSFLQRSVTHAYTPGHSSRLEVDGQHKTDSMGLVFCCLCTVLLSFVFYFF